MIQNTSDQWQGKDPQRIAGLFSRLGWVGFWAQVVLVTLPVFLVLYVTFITTPESGAANGINLGAYLSYSSLLLMVFTTYWFYRYAGLALKIKDPDRRPGVSSLIKTVWIGLWAGSIGIFFSMVLMMGAVGRLLFVLLTTPQTGIPIAAAGADPGRTLSAIDAVSLACLLLTLSAELTVLLFSIILLFSLTRRPKVKQL